MEASTCRSAAGAGRSRRNASTSPRGPPAGPWSKSCARRPSPLVDSGKVMANGRLADDAKHHVRHGMDFRIRVMGCDEIAILAEMAGMRLALKAAASEGGRRRPPPGWPARPASGRRGAYRARPGPSFRCPVRKRDYGRGAENQIVAGVNQNALGNLALVDFEYVGRYVCNPQNAVDLAMADHVPVHFEFFVLYGNTGSSHRFIFADDVFLGDPERGANALCRADGRQRRQRHLGAVGGGAVPLPSGSKRRHH